MNKEKLAKILHKYKNEPGKFICVYTEDKILEFAIEIYNQAITDVMENYENAVGIIDEYYAIKNTKIK